SLQLQAGGRRPGRSAADAGAAPPHRHDRTGAPASAARLRDARRRARLPRNGPTAERRAIGSVNDGGITGNPIVTAYFRAADEAPDSANGAAHSPQRTLLACVRD